MKTNNLNQIEAIKNLRAYSKTNFHKNTKRVNGLLVSDIITIVEKKRSRDFAKQNNMPKTDLEKLRYCFTQFKNNKGTSYAKILIEGNSGIYLASAEYGHSDYNKSRIFDKNEKTLKYMQLFNSFAQ